MNIDKTIIFNVDDKNVIVADLQTPVRKQFEILDAYRQELADIAIKYEMAQTAVNVKVLQMQEIVRQITAPPKQEPVAPAPVQEALPVVPEVPAANE